MTTQFRRTSLLASVLTLLLATGAIAQVGPGTDPLNDSPLDRWEQRLKLSPEQRQRIEGIRNQNREQMRTTADEMRQAQKRLTDLLSSDASEPAIRQQRQRVESLGQRLRDARFESLLRVRSVLNPQQRQDLAQQLGQRQERWGKRSGQGRSGQRGDRPSVPVPGS